MWRIIQDKYGYVTKRFLKKSNIRSYYYRNYNDRSTVMMIVKILDPIGVERRCRKRLKRRVYQNKVYCSIMCRAFDMMQAIYLYECRVQIMCGT